MLKYRILLEIHWIAVRYSWAFEQAYQWLRWRSEKIIGELYWNAQGYGRELSSVILPGKLDNSTKVPESCKRFARACRQCKVFIWIWPISFLCWIWASRIGSWSTIFPIYWQTTSDEWRRKRGIRYLYRCKQYGVWSSPQKLKPCKHFKSCLLHPRSRPSSKDSKRSALKESRKSWSKDWKQL